MKNLLTACLPALALFALGGCAGTTALTSSEDDGVYYSSKDHTTAIVSTAPAPATTDEAANPDYNGSTAKSSPRQSSGSDQYYDDSYTYMRGAQGPGLSYYTPYTPYTSLSYGGVYGWGGPAWGVSPYAYGGFYDPFYSPFYSPFGYGYGSGISISFGRSWGYGGFGRPYGYGYGSFYDPYYYSSPFYGGYYGRGGYYGNSYRGGNYGYSGNYGGVNDNTRYRTSGHRTDRASDGRYSSGRVSNPNGTVTSNPTGNGRMRTSERMASPGTVQPMPDATNGGRTRGEVLTAAPGVQSERTNESFNRPRRMERADQPRYQNLDPAANTAQPLDAQPNRDQIARDERRGRWRSIDAAPQSGQMQPAATPQPQEGRRRGGFFQNVFSEPSNVGSQATEQPTRQRSYDQPRQRTAEQPQQRSYEQPQQRSYEQPQRQSYSQPSYSAPSYGGGNSGGGGGRSRSRGN
ncbi:hypothetical protein [Hymenobacter terrenus]|uniref:hypothetical protein n=1 Tax=Hymenobacter terrenus TaxID=1629124 RepID=UPI000619F72F|nr:hypothetical protein [Hymenobacter terrenus]